MHVQTILVVEDIEALKIKTGEASTKEAIAKAVQHYLKCNGISEKPVLGNLVEDQRTIAKGAKIIHAQTVLMVEDIEALKQKTGEPYTKDALAKAVQHYLDCKYVRNDSKELSEKLAEVLKRRQGLGK